MSPLGRILFDAVSDCNRRIAAGVAIPDAADTLTVDLTAAVAEYAVTERAYSVGASAEALRAALANASPNHPHNPEEKACEQ